MDLIYKNSVTSVAKNKSNLLELIRTYNFETNFPESAHQKLLKYHREYLMVGGMPEAIQIHIETDDFNEVMNVHSSIIETYKDDFANYAKGADLLRLHRIFDYVISAAGGKAKYSNIDPNEKARELRKAIGLLEKANVISCVYHSKCSGLPLKVGKDDKVFKMFFLDIGLMNRICGIQNLPISQLEKAVRFDLNPPSIMDVVHQLTYEAENSEVSFKLMSLSLV